MNEGTNSDEELLALLQPPSMPDDFDFESNLNTKDTSDDDDEFAPLPGPAPPAPMAPMMMAQAALMVQAAAPTAPMGMDMPDAQSQNTQDHASLEDPFVDGAMNGNGAPNGVGSSQAQVEDDSDEIAYEPVKTPSRSSRSKSKRSTSAVRTSVTRPSSRRKPASARSRPQPRKPSVDVEEESETELPVEPAKPKVKSPEPEPKPESPKLPPPLDFEIVISPLPPSNTQEYKPIPPGDEIYRVLSRIPTGVPGETWLSVEFEDGHVDQVSKHVLISHTCDLQR